jgi:hypothetical protein
MELAPQTSERRTTALKPIVSQNRAGTTARSNIAAEAATLHSLALEISL